MRIAVKSSQQGTPAKPRRILVIEDEAIMQRVMCDCLEGEGYKTIVASDGVTGLDLAMKEEPDLIVLDLMLPGLDGLSLCSELRRLHQRTPILIVTAKGLVEDRVKGLDIGADDYLAKPFVRAEFLARIRSLLRRLDPSTKLAPQFHFGDITVDLKARTVIRSGRIIDLAPKEFEMLELLLNANGEPLTRDDFLDVVWGIDANPTMRTIDRHIVRLRRKLEEDPTHPKYIETVFGVGYRLQAVAVSSELSKRPPETSI